MMLLYQPSQHLTRHARACRGHPRLKSRVEPKTWMAGTSRTSPAMTEESGSIITRNALWRSSLCPRRDRLLLDHDARDCETQCFNRAEIDDQLYLDRLLHRSIGWLRSLEDPRDIVAALAEILPGAGAIAHETAVRDEYAIGI